MSDTEKTVEKEETMTNKDAGKDADKAEPKTADKAEKEKTTSEEGKTAEEKAAKKKVGRYGEKKVVNEGCTGTVKWFNVRRGYGFIAWTEGGEDVFVHRTAIPFSKANKEHIGRSLDEEEPVVFQIRERQDGLKEAWTVMGPDNGRLKGSRYARTKAQMAEMRRKRREQREERDAEKTEKEPPAKPQKKKPAKEGKADKDKEAASASDGGKDVKGGDGEGKPRRRPRDRKARPKNGQGDAAGATAEPTTTEEEEAGASDAGGDAGKAGKGRASRRKGRTDRRRRLASASSQDEGKDGLKVRTGGKGKDVKDAVADKVKAMVDKINGVAETPATA